MNKTSQKGLPTNMKVLKGTNQPCRTNKREPKLPIERSMAPAWLSDRGKEVYRELTEVLAEMQVLTKADRKALELLCDAYADYREAKEFIKQHGFTYETATEAGVMHRAYPQVGVASDAYKRIRSMMTEFGLTPASRSKVSAQGEQKEDPLQKYMNG